MNNLRFNTIIFESFCNALVNENWNGALLIFDFAQVCEENKSMKSLMDEVEKLARNSKNIKESKIDNNIDKKSVNLKNKCFKCGEKVGVDSFMHPRTNDDGESYFEMLCKKCGIKINKK